MSPHSRAAKRIVFLVFLALRFGSAQVLQPHDSSIPQSQRARSIRKHAIEGHFESIRPQPLRQFDGAVPGSVLLVQHRTAAAKIQARVRARLESHPQATSAGTALSGIMLRPALPAGLLPTSVVTGDFNGDGKNDFIVANGLTNDLWFYPGNGDGTFKLPQIIPLSKGLTPVGLETASLRNNGILDLVVAESDSATIGVLLGNGDGTFGYETEYQLPEPPASVVIDDFHHTGKLDIAAVMDTVVTFTGDQVPYFALLAGDGTGGFATPIIGYVDDLYFASTAMSIASGYTNGDGLPDVLITWPGDENSQIYLNNGDGTFAAGQLVIGNGDFDAFTDGRFGDVNGDGCLDAVVADLYTEAWVALGDCSGNFAEAVPIKMGVNNSAVRLADVNGDGNLDIITSSIAGFSQAGLGMYGGDSISVALGDGKGNWHLAPVHRDRPGVFDRYRGLYRQRKIGCSDRGERH